MPLLLRLVIVAQNCSSSCCSLGAGSQASLVSRLHETTTLEPPLKRPSIVLLISHSRVHRQGQRVVQLLCPRIMKFAEHLAAHITPEWRKQYIEYEEMKTMLYKAMETQISAEGKRRPVSTFLLLIASCLSLSFSLTVHPASCLWRLRRCSRGPRNPDPLSDERG